MYKYNVALNITDNITENDLKMIKGFLNKLGNVRINLDLIRNNNGHFIVLDNYLRHWLNNDGFSFVSRNPIRVFYKDEAELYLTNDINFNEIPEKIICRLGSFGMSSDIKEENIDKFMSTCSKYYPDVINRLYSFKQDIINDSYLVIDDRLDVRLCGFDFNIENSLPILNLKTKEVYNDFIFSLSKNDCYSYGRCSECGNMYCHATPYEDNVVIETQQISPKLCDKYKYLEKKIKEYCQLTYLNTLSCLLGKFGEKL